jgi:hypothetical protein
MTNGLSQGAANLLPKLSRCYIAESPQQARELGVQHPDLYFLLDDGQFYRGQTLGGGRKKASGPLALKREVRELSRKLSERESELRWRPISSGFAASSRRARRMRWRSTTRCASLPKSSTAPIPASRSPVSNWNG